MRTSFVSALAFAFLTSVSTAALATSAPSAAPAPAAVTAPATTLKTDQAGMVNINTANAEVLQKELAGIGANKAAAIVAYREENGAFTSVDELIEVKGIGKAILDKNREKLAIE